MQNTARILTCATLALTLTSSLATADVPINTCTANGLALAIPPVLASAVSVWGQHGLMEPGPDAEWSELSTNLTLLFLGSLAAQALSYAAALGVLVLAQGKAERDAAADFIVGFFIARIPILLFQAIQAALLPKLAALSGAGKHADFRSGLKKLVMIVLGVGVLGVVAGATIGPTVGEILFGDKFNLGSRDLTLLFLGSAMSLLYAFQIYQYDFWRTSRAGLRSPRGQQVVLWGGRNVLHQTPESFADTAEAQCDGGRADHRSVSPTLVEVSCLERRDGTLYVFHQRTVIRGRTSRTDRVATSRGSPFQGPVMA